MHVPRNLLRIHSSIAAILLAPALVQAAVIFTSESSFTDQLVAGSYLENFSGFPGGNQNEQSHNYSGGSAPFTYTILTSGEDNNLYIASGAGMPFGNAMSTTIEENDLVITFTSGNVTAVGAHFFLSDINENEVGGNITVTLSDGTIETFASGSTPFRGFTTSFDNPFTSLTISPVEVDTYATLDNLYVGTAVPEPSTYGVAAVVFLVAVSLLHRRRTRQQRA